MPPLPTAPAKVNLFLYASSPRADGYHPLESLVAFADFGDELTLAVDGKHMLSATDSQFRYGQAGLRMASAGRMTVGRLEVVEL